jgi:hypothetical protein
MKPLLSNRRSSLSYSRMFLVLAVTLCTFPFSANAQRGELDIIKGLMTYSDAPNSLYHHFAKTAFGHLDNRARNMANIKSLDDWKNRQNLVRQTLKEIIGKFPEKTPLNAKITGIRKKDGYRIENIIFESQPGFYVTSSLFIPENSSKAPAVIYCSGHSETGYRSYQNILVNLVKKGFVVFAFDPLGQGERLQNYNAELKKSEVGGPTAEHSYVGAQAFITGNTLANTMIWDGIRALDYLITRPEVDTSRIGITGRSGGGTQSSYIAAMEPRIKAVAPENYITDMRRIFQTIGPQDAEQNFPGSVSRGLDMADLLTVRAPMPALLIATSMDMFPIKGVEESAKEISRIYQAYGKPGAFKMVSDDGPHASTKKNRESMYAFFQETLNNPGDSTDLNIPILSTDDLQVSKDGQISTSLQSATVFDLNVKDVDTRIKGLDVLRNSPLHVSEILSRAKKLAAYQDPAEAPAALFVGRSPRKTYGVEKYILTEQQDYPIPYLLFKPDKPSGKGILYLNPEGKQADGAVGGAIESLVHNGFTVLVPDLIGYGEMGPGIFRGDSNINNVPYNTWFSAILLGESIVGRHASDAVKLSRILSKEKGITEVIGLAKREFAPVLLHAAAFEPQISRVALVEPYSSYRSVVKSPRYSQSFLFSTVPAVIGQYDLPDLAASLAPRKLLIAGCTDGNANSTNTVEIEKDLTVVRTAFQHNAANLHIIPRGGGNLQPVLNWLSTK